MKKKGASRLGIARSEVAVLSGMVALVGIVFFVRPAKPPPPTPPVVLEHALLLRDQIAQIEVNSPVNAPLKAQGGVPPYTFHMVSKGYYPTPPGLYVEDFGLLKGIPTRAGFYNLSIRVQDQRKGPGSWTVVTLPVRVVNKP